MQKDALPTIPCPCRITRMSLRNIANGPSDNIGRVLSGGLITEMKHNISISYHDGRPAERCFGLQSSFGP
jgi:hypothetical protein